VAAGLVHRLQLLAKMFGNALARDRAEQSMRDSQTTLTAIIDSTSDLIWSVDPNSFGIMTCNHGLRSYFLKQRGIRIEPGMRPEDLFPTQEYVINGEGSISGRWFEGRIPLSTSLQRPPHIALSFNPLKRGREVFGVSVFGRDITERKRARTR